MTYQKFHSERFSRLLASIIVSLSITLIYSCKKTDIANQADIVKGEDKIISQKTADDFFKLPADASPVLYRIANELQKQNKTQDFISNFIKKEGFPVWHKASIEAGGHKIKNNSNPGFDWEGLEDTTVYIPLVVSNQQYVHGFLKATVSDTVEIKIFRQNDYVYFPFQTPQSFPSVTTAENYALRMMLMDKEVFGSNEFKIRDKRMFNNSTDYRDTANIQRFIKLDTSSGGNYFSNGASVNNYTYEMCYTVVTLTNTTCPPFSGSGGSNVAGSCWTVSYSELCITYEVGGGEEGGGGGSWPFPPGEGGGGGGNPPGGGGGAPCEYFGASITNSVVPIECEPGSGENPWPSKDANGYYYSRIAELNIFLAGNPFGLDPCDSLTLINLQSYGSMYQRIAQYSSPPSVINRLDSVRQAQGGWVVDNFNVQSLEDAYGPVVNCDYFPLQITQFPTNPVTGQPMTPAEFVEYFRLNINSFITSPVNINFSCYFGASFDDCPKWNLTSGNALGALNHIYIPGNNGSVILSDYQHINNTNSEQHYFKFSTLETPFDYEHPVAGNREFGIFNTSGAPSHYTFYTMAVDRTWDWITAVGNALFGGFESSDELWLNIQGNLKNFINQNGGTANYYNQRSYIARPYWEDVKDYLKGIISFQTLRQRLGC